MTSFNTNLLSAASTGTPRALSTSLSASNLSVAVDELSGARGVAFTLLSSAPVPTLSAATLQGNSIRIATYYHNQDFGLINDNRSITLFTYNSSTTAQTSISGITYDAVYPELRRLVALGYA